MFNTEEGEPMIQNVYRGLSVLLEDYAIREHNWNTCIGRLSNRFLKVSYLLVHDAHEALEHEGR